MQVIGSQIKGVYRDVLMGPDGGLRYDSGWHSNTIVAHCRVLLADLMKGGALSGGIQHMAVGRGDEAWDGGGSPDGDPAARTGLVAQYQPFVPIDGQAPTKLELAYLDEAERETTGPTSRLQVTATLAPGYPPSQAGQTTYPLREFGLFGSGAGSRIGLRGNSYMINYVWHPVIHKPASNTLIRVIRLYF
jgi:hypothetical protein